MIRRRTSRADLGLSSGGLLGVVVADCTDGADDDGAVLVFLASGAATSSPPPAADALPWSLLSPGSGFFRFLPGRLRFRSMSGPTMAPLIRLLVPPAASPAAATAPPPTPSTSIIMPSSPSLPSKMVTAFSSENSAATRSSRRRIELRSLDRTISRLASRRRWGSCPGRMMSARGTPSRNTYRGGPVGGVGDFGRGLGGAVGAVAGFA